MNGRAILFGLLVLLLIGAAAGIGVYAYNAGVAQGLAQSGALGAPGEGPYRFYGGPFFYPGPFGFGFGLLGCLFPLLFLFLAFGLLRGLFWRGHWGRGWGRHGPWGKGAPPMFEEWHRRAHGESSETPASSQ